MKPPEQIDRDREKLATTVAGLEDGMRQTQDQVFQRALGRLVLMCEYAKRDLEIQKLRATGVAKDQVREKAAALHEWVSSHAADGVFLINAQRLNLNRMLNRYGVGPRGS